MFLLEPLPPPHKNAEVAFSSFLDLNCYIFSVYVWIFFHPLGQEKFLLVCGFDEKPDFLGSFQHFP